MIEAKAARFPGPVSLRSERIGGVASTNDPLRDRYPAASNGSLSAVLNNVELFRATAAGGSTQAVEIIHEGLKASSPSWRRNLTGEPRRALVFSLRELMAVTTTAEAAFRSLALLAEAHRPASHLIARVGAIRDLSCRT